MTSGTSTITVQKNSAIADIPPRIFGSFVEHLGRCVYGAFMSQVTPQPTKTDSAKTSSI